MATTHPTQIRALYRRFLRELPVRSPNILANPSPIHQHIRADFSSLPPSTTPAVAERRLSEAQQYLQYLRAQRQYITLIERYNPGMNMAEEDRVKMTARRVGMDLPEEFLKGVGGR